MIAARRYDAAVYTETEAEARNVPRAIPARSKALTVGKARLGYIATRAGSGRARLAALRLAEIARVIEARHGFEWCDTDDGSAYLDAVAFTLGDAFSIRKFAIERLPRVSGEEIDAAIERAEADRPRLTADAADRKSVV